MTLALTLEVCLPENRRYSLEFENAVAEYVIGNPSDRSEKTMFELYTKLGYAHSFPAPLP